MADVPLSFLRNDCTPQHGQSLGDHLADRLAHSRVDSLLACLPATDAPAIISPDPSRRPLTHAEVNLFITHFFLPTDINHAPLGPNDRIMVVLPTGPENALALMALASYHTCAPVNASCTGQELREDAARLRAKCVVATRDVEERLELAQLQAELGCSVVFVEPRLDGPAGLFDMDVMGTLDVTPRGPSKLHSMRDQSLVLHTSGTSGKKKVVPYTLRSLVVGTWAVVHSWDLRESDVNMNMMPLFHVGGIVRNLWAPMLSGGSAIMCAGFDAIAFWSLAELFKATWYYAAPTIHHAILTSQPEHIDPVRDMHIRMICNAAGGLLPSLAIDLKERFGGATILPSYGMTECMPITTPPQSYQLERPGCSGVACGPYLSIRDPSNLERALGPDKTGAVCVRGLPTFEGYETSPDINVPLDTSTFTSEGWFDSGDCGYMDEDGYLYITGRSKEIINKGGEVISPFEVEEAIVTAAREHVKTVLAFAVEHDVLQEAIGVVIVSKPDKPRLGLNQLLDLLRDYLHPSKWPFLIVYMNDLPKNAAGKPLRIKLAQRLNLGVLNDAVPASKRHIEADVPPPTAALSDPIACRPVRVDLHAIELSIHKAYGVHDVALRHRPDGSAEAFISAVPGSQVSSQSVKEFLTSFLPGYAVPDPLHVIDGELVKTRDGRWDFDAMEEDIQRENANAMSQTALIVREVVAELLNVDANGITGDSDFFLLGGNSLLLGKLSYLLRKKTGQTVAIAAIFVNSTISGIAGLIEENMPDTPSLEGEKIPYSAATSVTVLNEYGQMNHEEPRFDLPETKKGRGQNHLLCLICQAIPFVFFYPLKAAVTWSILLYVLAWLAPLVDDSYFARMGALLAGVCAGRLASRIICPITAIVFKWLVIGKYKPGAYKMWSNYYLRYWMVNQALRLSGRGLFSMHPMLETLYARMLGAKIGKNVKIDKKAKLGEYDLITIGDNVRIDAALVRGFCVDRDGYFRLDKINIGRNVTVNTYTEIAPGAVLPEGSVYGPHASSHENPSPHGYEHFNKTYRKDPHFLLKLFVAWPLMILVFLASLVPWFAALYVMLDQTFIAADSRNALVSVLIWFSAPDRVMWHAVARIIRAIATPMLQVILGIVVKRMFGLNRPCSSDEIGQLNLLRRYLTNALLDRSTLKAAFSLVGTHYEVVSIVYRLMGAKIGKRVYWPGSGIVCDDPELLELGNDVVFGSRSELITTDNLGSGKIVVHDGAMIADRCVLLPGTTIGRQAVMGSGSLSRRDTTYAPGSTWMGNDGGEAICFAKGHPEADQNSDTTTPFGRAFYKRQAPYFVFPYIMVLAIHIFVAALSAGYWSMAAVAAAQLLMRFHYWFPDLHLFAGAWYQFGVLYGLIAAFFIIILNVQGWVALLWVIVTKWIVIGRRQPGKYSWDESSYCQRWQLHLTLARPLYKGYGNGGVLAPLAGSVYMTWYFRALGANIGKNVCLYPGGKVGLMTEPDLVQLENDVALDACSVVAHINSRGHFSLNALKIGEGAAMRTGSRLLSGASMESSSMLCEHTLLTSGEIAEENGVYVGWPGKRVDNQFEKSMLKKKGFGNSGSSSASSSGSSHVGVSRSSSGSSTPRMVCPMCRRPPTTFAAPPCGHLFCEPCISKAQHSTGQCPTCGGEIDNIVKIQPSMGYV